MFDFHKLEIEGLLLVTLKVFKDERGFFEEAYKQSEFKAHGIADPFVQINHSHSKKGVLRGLHFQEGEYAQGKLVSCMAGEIFDVAVDIRPTSPTFGKYVAVRLCNKRHHMFYIPKGFAHGFYTLTERAEVVYLTTAEYEHSAERGILYNDPLINIAWPAQQPILSEKDRQYPLLKDTAEYKEYIKNNPEAIWQSS